MCIKNGNVLQIKSPSPQVALWRLDAAAIPGDTVIFYRGRYKHFGLYINDGWIIDFSDPDKENTEKGEAEARWRSAEDAVASSVQLDIYYCCQQIDCICREITISRAIEAVEKAQLGEGLYARGKYSLLYNNCEHFCYDCVHHKPYSSQSTYGVNYGITPIATGVSGIASGAAVGAGVGLAGGPFSAVTVPIGATTGAVVGGITGITSSMAVGGIRHKFKWSALTTWCSYNQNSRQAT